MTADMAIDNDYGQRYDNGEVAGKHTVPHGMAIIIIIYVPDLFYADWPGSYYV